MCKALGKDIGRLTRRDDDGSDFRQELSAVTSNRLRLMFLVPFVPRADAPHGGRATTVVIRRLAERHDVALLYLRESGTEPPDDVLLKACTIVEEVRLARRAKTVHRLGLAASLTHGRPMEAYRSASDEFRRRAQEVAARWKPDVVQAEMTRMAQYLPSVAGLARARVIVAYEADAASAADAYAATRSTEKIFRAADLQAWRRYERATFALADAIVTFSERDREILQQVAGSPRVVTIPLRVEVPSVPYDPVGSSPPTVIFVGGFGHPPNVDAALRLAGRIFPDVRASCPDAQLEIVGPEPPRALRALAGDGVSILGRVPAVETHLDRAAVVAAPIALGGGVRVKVLEALAGGKAVVASRRAIEGIPVSDGREAIIVDSDEDFAAATIRLLRSPAERRRLADAARTWSERHLDPGRSALDFEDLYESLLG
jgi:glycosyltransferase involved in cell wall biosynthesis